MSYFEKLIEKEGKERQLQRLYQSCTELQNKILAYKVAYSRKKKDPATILNRKSKVIEEIIDISIYLEVAKEALGSVPQAFGQKMVARINELKRLQAKDEDI